jgi:predicted glycoside hydrolase/deacetylase ChbG (UPF0249 family)
VIVTADDFGYDANRNEAIVRAFERGLITHTSVMANMPAFEEACELARDHGLGDRTGVHLVLTEGEPLTDAIRGCRRFCDDSGAFYEWRADERAFVLPARDAEALSAELRAQIERCRVHGLPVVHADSHHHVHNELAIGRVLTRLARQLAVPRVRIARNCGPGIGVVHRVYKLGFNSLLRRSGLAGTSYFGGVEDVAELARSRDGAPKLARTELMTHPILDDAGHLVDEGWPAVPFDELLGRITP